MSDETIDDLFGDDPALKLGAARHENRRLRDQVIRAEAKIADLTAKLEMVDQIAALAPDPPAWLAPPPRGKHHGTILLALSDTHFDEIVEPDQVLGLNAYNRSIAELRLHKAFSGAISLPRDYVGTNLVYDGIVVAHAGDLITGEIHDELIDTNEGKPTETIEFFLDPMIAGIKMLADHYGKVHVVEVDGNHDRMYRRKRAKGAVSSSWSWLFWRQVARAFANDKRVTVTIPPARDTIFSIYDTSILMHHGDQFSGGGGIAGPLTPISIGDYRKRRKHNDAAKYAGRTDLAFDLQLMGHFHHRNSLPGIITVGSLKGYDEYAGEKNYPFEPASQELLVVTPERGITVQLPVWVTDREKEGW